MKKRMIAALCAVTAAGILCSCAPKNVLEVEKEKEPVILEFFLPMSIRNVEGEGGFLYLIEEYNASHEDIQLQVEGISVKDGYNEILEKRLASGKGNDLFAINADSVKKFVSHGYLYDLSELPACDRLYPAAKDQSKTDGIVYTIPLTMSAYGMWVNTGLLEQYGLSAPDNYDSWMHCCEVLKENGITPFAINRWYGMTVPVMARGLYPLYQSGEYEKLAQGLNDGTILIGDYMIEGFKMFEEFLHKGYYGDNLTKDYVDGIPACTTDLEAFQNQKAAFAFLSCGAEKYFDNKSPLQYQAQGVPALPDGVICLPSISDRLCVNANREHLEEALDVAEFMTNSVSGKLLTNGGGVLPSREGQEGSPMGAEHIEDLLYLTGQDGQIPIEDMNLHFTYWDTIRTLCLEMIDGMTAEEAAQEYNRIQLEQLDAYDEMKQISRQ